MLRQTFLFLSTQQWAYRLLLANPITRAMAWRFVAGEDEAAAIAVVRQLAAVGIMATLDHLGEHVTNEAEARAATAAALSLLGTIQTSGVTAHLSIKLTQFGLDLGADFCRAEVRRVLARAREIGTFVRIDMEGSAYTQRTLDLFYEFQEEFGARTVGIVLQAYLRRNWADVDRAIATGSRVRLVKGAYDEPPDLAYPDKAAVDRAYRIQMEQLLARGNYPAIATHDERLIGRAQGFAAAEGLDEHGFEFQMLYGVRRELQTRLAAQGYNVRCYVPYGTQWYPYFMRRLAERPANLVFLLANLGRR